MTVAQKAKRPASRRVSWPEPGHEGGGEFRLTVGRLTAIIAFLIALASAFPAWWTISDHWMNRAEIEKAMKSHSDHDAGVQQWNQFGFAANRLDFLEDKAAECEIKKAVQGANITPDEVAICARYAAKQKAKSDEAAALKAKALEATKEKP